jgi:hypothetical protein
MTKQDTVTFTIVPRLDPFMVSMAGLVEALSRYRPVLLEYHEELIARPRRSTMHAAYRAKTRRRNRR